MAKTASNMLPLGTPAPLFTLPDLISDTQVSLHADAAFKATVITFICNHCPYVKYINHELVHLANEYIKKNIRFFAINANDSLNYPEDAPIKMKEVAQNEGYPFPYLFDETQKVAKAYQAACTPDFYVFDNQLKLVYRGQFDDARPGNDFPVNGNSLRQALDDVLSNKPVASVQKPSLGCNIKWKSTV